MPIDIPTILTAIKAVGVPAAYLAFTMWLLVWLIGREQTRTREAEARNAELQAKLFALGQATVEAALRNEAAIQALARASQAEPRSKHDTPEV